jgi:hypothetical protein
MGTDTVTTGTGWWLRSIVRFSGGLLFAGLLATIAPANVQADDWCNVECSCATLVCGGTDDCQGYCDGLGGTCLQLCGENEQWIYCRQICPGG